MSLDVVLRQDTPIPLDVNLAGRSGELLALIGPSGSGKTTVLRAIAGLSHPREGRIVVDGEVWFHAARGIWRPPQARSAGLVFQDYALLPHLTAIQNVALPLLRRPLAERTERARQLLSQVNLDGLANRRPDQLSGGQRQRVALARALARDPKVLLLDEPFSAVDQMTRERLKRELVGLRKTIGMPIVLVTHDLEEAMALADRIVVLHRGRTLAAGSPDAIRLRPPTPTVARLMGQTNIFAGVVETPSTHDAPGRLRLGPLALDTAETGNFKAGDAVSVLVSGEHVVLHRRGRPSLGEKENPVAGRVVEMVRLGEQTSVSARLQVPGAAILNFRLPTHAARRNELSPGGEIVVSLLRDGIHLMAPERSHTA